MSLPAPLFDPMKYEKKSIITIHTKAVTNNNMAKSNNKFNLFILPLFCGTPVGLDNISTILLCLEY